MSGDIVPVSYTPPEKDIVDAEVIDEVVYATPSTSADPGIHSRLGNLETAVTETKAGAERAERAAEYAGKTATDAAKTSKATHDNVRNLGTKVDDMGNQVTDLSDEVAKTRTTVEGLHASLGLGATTSTSGKKLEFDVDHSHRAPTRSADFGLNVVPNNNVAPNGAKLPDTRAKGQTRFSTAVTAAHGVEDLNGGRTNVVGPLARIAKLFGAAGWYDTTAVGAKRKRTSRNYINQTPKIN